MWGELVPAALLVGIAISLQGCGRSPRAHEAAFLKKGEILAGQRQYARAILEFRNAIQATPKDAEPYYRLGIVYMHVGDLFNAFRAFYKATELNPRYAPAQIKIAELLDLGKNSDFSGQAARRLQGVLLTSPDNEEATGALAITEFEIGNTKQATRLLEDSLQKFPTSLKTSVVLARILIAKNDLKGAEAVLKKAVAVAPGSSAARLALGDLYLLRWQPKKAKPAIEKAIQLDPKNGRALLALALLQIRGKQMADAGLTLKRVSALPNDAYRDLHAVFLYQIGQQDAAIAELEAIVSSHPDDRQARSRLLAIYLQTNRMEGAQKLLDAALKRNRLDTDALYERSQVYLKMGKPHKAELDLAALIHLRPDSGPAHFALARVYRKEGLGNSERQQLENTLALNIGFLAARLALARNFLVSDQARDALQILDAAPPSQKGKPAVIATRNWALIESGQFKEVRATLAQALRNSRTPDLLLQDGLLKMQARDYLGARSDAEEMLEQSPQDSRGARLLADTYLAENKASEATPKLAQLAVAQKNAPSVQLLTGQWYMKNGQMADARKAFETALTDDAEFAPAAMNLAGINIRQHHFKAARQLLEEVTQRQPHSLPAFLLLADVDRQMGDRRDEISAYKSALAIDNSNEYALNNLACAIAPDDPDQAQRLAEQAVAIAPENAAAQDTLGWIYYRKGMYSAALYHLKLAVARDPNPRRELHLAMSYEKAGQPEAARSLLKKALAQNSNLPKNEQAR